MTADHRANLAAFVAMTFALSWACWIPAALSSEGISVSWIRWLSYAGALGPAAAGMALTYATKGKEGRDDYWSRVTDCSRIPFARLTPVLLLYPVATALALLLDAALTGHGHEFGIARSLLADPQWALPFAIWTLLLGPLPEELGWRGYALDEMLRKWSPVTSSIALGTVWALWHLPLFFIKGTYQHNLGLGTASFWSYGVTVIEVSVLLTWVYVRSHRSILAAIVLHFVLNLTGSLLDVSSAVGVARSILLAIPVVAVIRTWQGGSPRPRAPA